MKIRKSIIKRKTNETDISIEMNLDGSGKNSINTGVGFFDHMLELFSYHSGIDLNISCVGDIDVDFHHTVEDIAICMGKLIKELLGDKKGIARYASFYIPMDETLSRCVIDISGREFLVFNAEFIGKIGNFDSELIEEFFRAIAFNSGTTLHLEVLYGKNQHHKAESLFKAYARALKQAISIVGNDIPSSKGVIE